LGRNNSLALAECNEGVAVSNAGMLECGNARMGVAVVNRLKTEIL